MELLDFMTLETSRNQISDEPTNSSLENPIYQLDQAFDWPTFDFPGGIYDLLAG
jgi:hypothetical protein